MFPTGIPGRPAAPTRFPLPGGPGTSGVDGRSAPPDPGSRTTGSTPEWTPAPAPVGAPRPHRARPPVHRAEITDITNISAGQLVIYIILGLGCNAGGTAGDNPSDPAVLSDPRPGSIAGLPISADLSQAFAFRTTRCA